MADVINIEHGDEITHLVWSAGPKDEYNRPTNVYTPTVLTGVGIDVPDATEPNIDAADQEEVDIKLFLPEGTFVHKNDQFLIYGEKYQAVGSAKPLKNFFTGDMYKTEAKARRVDG